MHIVASYEYHMLLQEKPINLATVQYESDYSLPTCPLADNLELNESLLSATTSSPVEEKSRPKTNSVSAVVVGGNGSNSRTGDLVRSKIIVVLLAFCSLVRWVLPWPFGSNAATCRASIVSTN